MSCRGAWHRKRSLHLLGHCRRGLNPGELPPWGESRPSGVGPAPSMEVISPHGLAVKPSFTTCTRVPHPHPVSRLREGLLSSWVGDLESWRPPGDSTAWEALHSMSLGRGSRLLTYSGVLGDAECREDPLVMSCSTSTGRLCTWPVRSWHRLGFVMFLTSASTLVCSTVNYPPHSF